MNLNKVTVGALLAMLASIVALLTQLETISAWMPPSKSDLAAMESRIMAAMRKEQAADADKRRALGWYIARNRRNELLSRPKPPDEANRHRLNREIEDATKLMKELSEERRKQTFIREFR